MNFGPIEGTAQNSANNIADPIIMNSPPKLYAVRLLCLLMEFVRLSEEYPGPKFFSSILVMFALSVTSNIALEK